MRRKNLSAAADRNAHLARTLLAQVSGVREALTVLIEPPVQLAVVAFRTALSCRWVQAGHCWTSLFLAAECPVLDEQNQQVTTVTNVSITVRTRLVWLFGAHLKQAVIKQGAGSFCFFFFFLSSCCSGIDERGGTSKYHGRLVTLQVHLLIYLH